MHGQKVVAVDPQARQAIAHRARGERGPLAPGYALKGRYGPLVVDDIEHHRRPVDRGEGQGVVEVGLGRGPIADPGGGDLVVTLIGRGHRPADGLAELGAQIAGNGEESERLAGIHAGQLAALQRVGPVRIDLAHHLEQGIAARDQQALLPIGGKAHVLAIQSARLGDRHRFFTPAFDIERDLALALHPVHALVIGAGQHHVLQPSPQGVGIELGVPGAHRLAVLAQYPDQAIGQIVNGGGFHIDLGARHGSGRRRLDRAEIGRVPRPNIGFGDVQRKGQAVLHSGVDPEFHCHQSAI